MKSSRKISFLLCCVSSCGLTQCGWASPVELGSYLFLSPRSEGPVDDLGTMHQIWGWLLISFMESFEKQTCK